MGSEPVIEVDSLVKRYGDLTAVDNISFKVQRGEVFAFCGPNGAGKTTTVEVLECLRVPTSGNAKVLGLDISKRSDLRAIRSRIGVLPQQFNTFELLTVKESLEFFGSVFDKHVDSDELIKIIDMTEYANMLYKNLSGGLKQRVGVAIALVNDPEIVFLDEPTTGLDPKARRGVWDVITNLKKSGKTVFLTTHYMDEVEALADNVDVILNGKIVAEGSPRRLISKYGGQQTLVVEEGKEEAYNVLKRILNDVVMEPNGDVLVKISSKSDIANAFSALDENSVVYGRFSVKGASFDDVFLNLTGKKLVEGELQ
ncbi:MAG: ABC transporter ATP-binding protein [Thaumarchaeota archaeon]|nr:ABC transporter ATP-binding protein [Nitrososphaerota archaeon]MCL5317779.1 ABC transporter ATP-binding protein [Nitrososphaerota archaeon]